MDDDLGGMSQESQNTKDNLLHCVYARTLYHDPHDSQHIPFRRPVKSRIPRDDVLLPNFVRNEPCSENILAKVDRIDHVHERRNLRERHDSGLREPDYGDRVDACG